MREVVVFGRVPQAGRVKTRLARVIGDAAATEVYAALLANTLAEAAATATTLFFLAESPPQGWVPPAGIAWEVQREGDLGQRMRDAFARRFAAGAREVLLVGSDSPAIDRVHLAAAFAALQRAPVVLGPAADGGYWLVGQCRPGVDLFSDVPWSSTETLERTYERLDLLGVEAVEVAALRDLDEASDLLPCARHPGVPPDLRRTLERAAEGLPRP